MSKGGGGQPRWRRDGKELFYRARGRTWRWISDAVTAKPKLACATPQFMLDQGLATGVRQRPTPASMGARGVAGWAAVPGAGAAHRLGAAAVIPLGRRRSLALPEGASQATAPARPGRPERLLHCAARLARRRSGRRTMSLSAGTRLGPYEIVAPLGKRRDGRSLQGDGHAAGSHVAIKVLPAEWAQARRQ